MGIASFDFIYIIYLFLSSFVLFRTMGKTKAFFKTLSDTTVEKFLKAQNIPPATKVEGSNTVGKTLEDMCKKRIGCVSILGNTDSKGCLTINLIARFLVDRITAAGDAKSEAHEKAMQTELKDVLLEVESHMEPPAIVVPSSPLLSVFEQSKSGKEYIFVTNKSGGVSHIICPTMLVEFIFHHANNISVKTNAIELSKNCSNSLPSSFTTLEAYTAIVEKQQLFGAIVEHAALKASLNLFNLSITKPDSWDLPVLEYLEKNSPMQRIPGSPVVDSNGSFGDIVQVMKRCKQQYCCVSEKSSDMRILLGCVTFLALCQALMDGIGGIDGEKSPRPARKGLGGRLRGMVR